MSYVVLCGVISVTLTLAATVSSIDDHQCPEGTFRPDNDVMCRPCSSCPDNLVIREVCKGSRDTVCGPFSDFMFNPEYQLDQGSKSQGLESKTEESKTLQVVSVIMIVLLAVTSAICVTMAVLIYYKRLKEKKDGLMYSTDKISDSEPGYSGWHVDNEHCRKRPPSVTDNDETDDTQACSFKLQPIKTEEKDSNT